MKKINIDRQRLRSKKVVVVGDFMIDQYIEGETSRISPEAPVPVVNVISENIRLGGAANVAANLAALDCGVTFIGLTGVDEYCSIAKKLFKQYGIRYSLVETESANTLRKMRVVSRQQHIVRVDFQEKYPIHLHDKLMEKFKAEAATSDVIIFSDYGKGTLHKVSEMIHYARALGKVTIVDPKGSDFSKYAGSTFITPNFLEFENIVGDCPTEADVVERALALKNRLDIQGLIITRSEKGVTAINDRFGVYECPSIAREVHDVTGAGDTFIAVLAVCIASDLDIKDAIDVANVGAGVVVGKFGTATVGLEELTKAVNLHECDHVDKVIDIQGLEKIVNEARNLRKRVVMTNGCFDILHAGHVDFLEAARKLGDILVVAVNSDASVRSLKGSDRPINALADRQRVLAGLKCVDWVTSFNDSTPEALYQRVPPDILVKGGDYTINDVVGRLSVESNGGFVSIIPLRTGYSTSSVIRKIVSGE